MTIIDIQKQLTTDPEIQKVLESQDFYFQKAVEALDDWKKYEIETSFAEELLKMNYQVLKNSDDKRIIEVKDKIFTLVAYCDTHAGNYTIYNKYEDFRRIAAAGIYQNAWIIQLIKYKQDKTSITQSIKNCINYLENPEKYISIYSEDHKRKISEHLFGKEYSIKTFEDDLKDYFCQYNIQCRNPKNYTRVCSLLIYGCLNSIWNKNEVLGLLHRDTGNWKNDFFQGVKDYGYGVFWKHQVSEWSTIKPQLRELVDNGGFFYYNISNNWTDYCAHVIDFADKDDYYQIRDDWKEKNPFWFTEKFEDNNDGNKWAKVVFLVDRYEKVNTPTHIDNFKTFNKKNATVQNAVAYTQILTDQNQKKTMELQTYTDILKKKKNIILQGAPGTGKTYNTAMIALSICGVEDGFDFSDHKKVMEEYDKLVEERRIAFTTFHQSLDYEDFVEGLKPELINDNVNYKIEDGIFKTICDEARGIKSDKTANPKNKIDFSKTRIFKMSLGEKGKDDNEIFSYCLENNCVCLGWGGQQDFSKCKNLEDYKKLDSSWGAQAIFYFKEWMKIGDIILISNGNKALKAIAKVTGEYEFKTDAPIEMCQFRKVEWLYTGENIPVQKIYDKNFSQQSIYAFGNSSNFGQQNYNGNIKTDEINKIITGDINNEALKNYVIIIDEINRGNVSKIFGELITLLESDKRESEDHPISVTLPYSKVKFSVPSNLYIIGTMNTTDRSTGTIDYAIRRRFAFLTLKSDKNVLIEKYGEDSKQVKIFDEIRIFINDKKTELDIEDLMIGHSYFMDDNLNLKFDYEIIPLIKEYQKDGIINVDFDELNSKIEEWKKLL